jgi:hypothetical protein
MESIQQLKITLQSKVKETIVTVVNNQLNNIQSNYKEFIETDG